MSCKCRKAVAQMKIRAEMTNSLNVEGTGEKKIHLKENNNKNA